jgi:hypothetical protein
MDDRGKAVWFYENSATRRSTGSLAANMEFRTSIHRTVCFLGLALIMLGVGYYMIRTGAGLTAVMGWAGVVFFGLSLVPTLLRNEEQYPARVPAWRRALGRTSKKNGVFAFFHCVCGFDAAIR